MKIDCNSNNDTITHSMSETGQYLSMMILASHECGNGVCVRSN